jgi:HEAT repeat protein
LTTRRCGTGTVPDFPINDVLAPVGWIFLALLAVNLLLFAALVVLREEWSFHVRRRERIRARLGPVVERHLTSGDPLHAAEQLRPVIAGLGRQERPVAAWILRDLTRGADEPARARVRAVLDETGAIELTERSTRRWMPWRRALACEILGSLGADRSVPVLVERLDDRRSEVRMAAARALGEIGSPAAAESLTSVFLGRRAVPTGVAYHALRSLGPHGAAAFGRGLRSPDPTIRVASCFGTAALAEEIGGASAVEAVAQLLAGDRNTRVRTAAAKALGVVGGTTPPRILVEAAGDPEVRVRREAITALGLFDEPASVEILAAAAMDPDREVALRSAEALIALGSRPAAGEAARAAVASSSAWSVDYARTISELAA